VDRVCICNPYWSSQSDFIIVEDCTASEIGIPVLWAITLLVTLVVLFQTSWIVLARFENFFLQMKNIKGYTLMKNPGLLSVIFMYCIALPSVIVMSILHFIVPTTRIALDPLPTFLFFIGKTGLYLAAMFLQGPLLAIALKGERASDNLVRVNNIFNRILNFCAIIVGGIPFITLVNFETDLFRQYDVIKAYYFTHAILLFLQFSESYLVKLRLNYVFNRVSGLLVSSGRTDAILLKVNAVQNQIIRQALVQAVLNVIMGTVPYLLNKHAYFLPISWIALPVIGKYVALQYDLDKKTAKSVAQRLKMMIGKSSDTSSNEHRIVQVSSLMNQPQSPTMVSRDHNDKFAMVFESVNPIAVKPLLSQYGSADGMEEILDGDSNEENRKKFADFVRSHYASDSLHFYDAVVEFEKLLDAQSRKSKGVTIMKTFILNDASEPIDLPYEMRAALIKTYETQAYDAKTFQAAKKMSFELLKSNFYYRFTASLDIK